MPVRVSGEVVQRAGSCIEEGGVVLLPTDTVYGLAVHPRKPEAISRLFAMKGRPRSQNLPVMVHAEGEITRLGGVISSTARRLLDSTLFPGPVTLAVGIAAEKAADWLRGRDEFAVRMPADDELLAILERVGPLLVTSANFHAKGTRESVREILASLEGEPDLVIDGGRRASIPSTLVNCRRESPVVERAGVVSVDEISAVLGMPVELCL